MDTTLFAFTWRHSRVQQIGILALTLASFPFVYLSLELPKIIINEAIAGTGFPRSVLGVEFGQIPYLLMLCGLFLALIVLINAFKWAINVSVGMLGERMLRRLRYMLYERVLRFRMERFRKQRPGEIIQSILGEIEPLGGFIGEIIATPVFQGGLLATYMVFIFVQDPYLGAAAVALYPFQAWLIPRLQRKVIRLNRERARNTRELADWIGESVANAGEIHVNDTGRWHLAQVSRRLHTNTLIRKDIFERKFTIKFINNFLNQLPPFFFYAVGGYLVIRGELDFGSLVAVIAAYRDVAAPWKELLDYVQRWTDFSSRYTFVVENFVGPDVHDEARVHAVDSPPLRGAMTLRDVTGGPGTGGLQVRDLAVEPGATVAVLGGDGGAREAMLRLMAGLGAPASGRVCIGDTALAEATLPQLGAAVAWIGREPAMFTGSLRLNMIYGLLRNAPPMDQTGPEAAAFLREARRTGNAIADPDGDWVDYAAAGLPDAAALDARLLDLVARFGLARDIVGVALGSTVPAAEADRWAEPILAARRRFAAISAGFAELVERWDERAWNSNASLLSNLLFALPAVAAETLESGIEGPLLGPILRASGGFAILDAVGWDIATEFRSVVEAVGPDSPVLERFAGYSRAEITEAATLAAEAQARGASGLDPKGRSALRRLAARFIETRDQLDIIGADRKAAILAARAAARPLVATQPGLIPLDAERFNPGRTLIDNILHAPRRFDRRATWKRLDDALDQVIEAEGLRPALIRLGLDRPLGEAGLSGSALRRVALIRAVLKRPAFVLLDGVAGGDAPEDKALRARLRAELPDAALIYAASGESAVEPGAQVIRIARSGMVEAEERP
jgi:putative ABC transport system ATP-binding protein